ncbi:MAG: septation protein IspZ [Pseudomonadales bacterium]|nr:septation protein IspZ [Pseudomonadales bacterium]
MKQFIEFLPIALFVGVYFYTRDIYVSTGVLMVAIFAQVVVEYLAFRHVERKTQVIFWAAMLFGGATLLFRNEAFIQWKPTVVNWLFAVALLSSQFIGKENLLKKMLAEQMSLPNHVWRNLNLGWSFGFFLAGVLNLIVAYYFTLDFWVSYKLVGGFAITLIYIVLTVTYLVKGGYITEHEQNRENTHPADANQ